MPKFDTVAFYAAIDRVRQERGVTWYGVFRATGVLGCTCPSKRAHVPTRANRAALATWAGIDARDYEREAVAS